MKKLVLIVSMTVTLGLLSPTVAKSDLTVHNNSTVTQTRNDGKARMWTKNANLALDPSFIEPFLSWCSECTVAPGGSMTWDTAEKFIDYLNATAYLGYDDWELPQTGPVDPAGYNRVYCCDGSCDYGYNIVSPNSEMAYMYYVELDGVACTSGENCDVWPDPCGLPDEVEGISNLEYSYWSGTPGGPNLAWFFDFATGRQYEDSIGRAFKVWPVRDAGADPSQKRATPSIPLLLLDD